MLGGWSAVGQMTPPTEVSEGPEAEAEVSLCVNCKWMRSAGFEMRCANHWMPWNPPQPQLLCSRWIKNGHAER